MRATLVLGLGLLLVVCGACGKTDAPSEPASSTEPPPAIDRPQPTLPELLEEVEQRPQDPFAHRRLAIALHAEKRKQEAVEHFEKVVELDPSTRHLLDLALAYASISRLPEAESIYQRILEASPDHAIALHNLANLAVQRGELERAIGLYQRAIAARPGYIIAQFHLGEAYKRAERFEEAYRAFEGVLQLEPKDAKELVAFDDALYQLAALDLQMGANERAVKMLTVLIGENPDHPNAHYALGQALLKLGRTEEAQREFETHLQVQAKREPTGPVATE